MLYTGIDEIKVEDQLGTTAEANTLYEVESALAYPPNGALLGSSSVKSPLQIGLWTYNALVDKDRKGLKKWFFDTFSASPVTISRVSPDVRTKVAANLLQSYGYFRGKVDYQLVDQRNPKKQKRTLLFSSMFRRRAPRVLRLKCFMMIRLIQDTIVETQYILYRLKQKRQKT